MAASKHIPGPLASSPWGEGVRLGTISAGTTISCGVGAALGDGQTAGFSISVGASVGAATGSGTAAIYAVVGASVGSAVGGGSATIGGALSAQVGVALADGSQATILEALNAGVGSAIAAGSTADVQIDSGEIAAAIGAAIASGIRTGIVSESGYASGGWVRIGKRRMRVDPLDPVSLREAFEAAQDEGAEEAEVIAPIVQPAVVAKQQVKPVEVVRSSREDAQAFAKFLAQVRSEYEAAVRTAMIIRLMKEAEDDDEEALLLLM